MKLSSTMPNRVRLFFLKTGLGGHLTKSVKLLTISCFALFFALSRGYSETPPGQVNRSLPKFSPPRTTLEFSPNPSEEEFFRARVFVEPLVPIGGKPTADENADLAVALLGYAERTVPDDFASLTDYLEKHPDSPWTAALLTDLGLEYYNTAHYSLALDAWEKAWPLGQAARNAQGKALADRAGGELAYMYARLGRMTELDALLKSVGKRPFTGPGREKINGAREGLWIMQNRPEVAFRCGPLALQSIKLVVDPKNPETDKIFESASTQKGFSLPQVAELSRKVGLNYQMAYREQGGTFSVPSVVHWKVGHYAALVRQEGNLYLLKDPTFRNNVWATQQALEAETSGYFLIRPGKLPRGWRTVDVSEGASVWGKGQTSGNDPGPISPKDPSTGFGTCKGMMVSAAHLMDVNLSLKDEPVGYTPPVGPAARFTLRYNSRDAFQPANFPYANLGSQWTFDWLAYITDNPMNPLADVNYYFQGGGDRTFTDFNTNTEAFAYQQYDQTLLTRTSPNTYQMLWPDGSKLIFGQPDGSAGTTRSVFLTKIMDPQGNALTFTYDTNFLLVAATDAIGQVTTLTYGAPASPDQNLSADPYKLTKVTDPFGRSATFDYVPFIYESIMNPSPDSLPAYLYEWVLGSVTDEIGLTSQVGTSPILVQQAVETNDDLVSLYDPSVTSLITPYGTNTFTQGGSGTTRFLETTYPDGSRDRVEYNQTITVQSNGLPMSDPVASVPLGVGTFNQNLDYRNTYYWSRNACATSYGDYSKARVYHWLHTSDLSTTSGIIESTKEPLENRVWYDYEGQNEAYQVGSINLPAHVGRVLDDGSTQLYTSAYNFFGHLTNSIDPMGRTFSYIYDTNGIDLLEARQTRANDNELLAKATYNSQHRPLTVTDAAGQTTSYTYNARGQVVTQTDAKNETVTYSYDANGYLMTVKGPLSGTNDVSSLTYDFYGRIRTMTSVSGYTLTFDYDNLDRMTRITFPDATFLQNTYDRLDRVAFQDRAGRQASFNFDNMRHLTKMTDPLGRVTLSEWCRCGDIKSITDPLGRTTSWITDVEGRKVAQHYGDGSQINYVYENTSSRLKQIIDQKQQSTICSYNPDNTIESVSYGNSTAPTPNVTFTYDTNYKRVISMTDGIGTTTYNYLPITTSPVLGAGRLGSEDGPLPNETVTFVYDELGRTVQDSIDGDISSKTLDAAGRITGTSDALGTFTYAYDGSSPRLVSEIYPNGQSEANGYGNVLQDFMLLQITNAIGASPISQFGYSHDILRGQITAWSQQSGSQSPSIFTFGYDADGQLLSAEVTNSGVGVNAFAYTYDLAGNRLTELAGGASTASTYNALNQLSTKANASVNLRTNEWDGLNRLTAVNAGANRTEFAYDGLSRLAYIRELENGSEISFRRFVWCNGRICEERDKSGTIVNKRFFPNGFRLETGTNAGAYYYTRDHLGSIRELIDAGGNLRARYAYDPFGRRTKVSGDVDADFGFAGMLWSSEASLALAHFRVYDPELGRWLSRDPVKDAEIKEGPNLYSYAANDPVNLIDPLGLEPGGEITEAGGEIRELTESELAELSAQREADELFLDYLQQIYNEIPPPAPQLPPTGVLLPDELDPSVEALLQQGGLVEVPDPVAEVAAEIEPPVPFDAPPPFEIPETINLSSISGPLNIFVGAGITVLTMTDCNTVQGILGLVRQGKGGLLNIYEDQQLRQLEQNQ